MTKLTRENPITRETATSIQGRPIIIELHEDFMMLRTKGTREQFLLPYDSIFWMAVKKSVDRNRVEKQQAKRGTRWRR